MGNTSVCMAPPEEESAEFEIPTKRRRRPQPLDLHTVGGGLAARRNLGGELKVATAQRLEGGRRLRVYRRIQRCSNLGEKYIIGSQVMPSSHVGMQVMFGRMKASGSDVIIKVRSKRCSFNGCDEREWREAMEFMLNFPPSSNICQMHEVLEDMTNYYVVMEKCGGVDLFESLHGSSKLTINESKDVLIQILTALSSLHARGLVHKDLKLENVMVDRTPANMTMPQRQPWSGAEPEGSPIAVKLIDFDTVEEHTLMSPKTAKNVLGTDQYIAPDAYEGDYSPASDVFAVGVIAYRLLVGRFPFEMRIFDDKPGENWVGSPKMKEVRNKVCKYKVSYDHEVFKQEPQAYNLVRSMLAVNKEERPTAQQALSHPWIASR